MAELEIKLSRIGRKPINIPAGVDVKFDNGVLTVKGPKGTLTQKIHQNMIVEIGSDVIEIKVPDDKSPKAIKQNRALHGLTRSLVANMVTGVTEGYQKKLEVKGVGYRVQKKGKELVMNLGYSHQVIFTDTADVTIDAPDQNTIIVSGADKQKVGQMAAEIREKRPPEPYKGKGIKYADEVIRRKEGKAGKGGKK
ncbi:MAG: 50S ribosomal protein L6 [Acutalibacteraceae bacterium]|nr:50S ribosomal protein L6 [Acutalibacteraceae bacterium]